MTAVLLVLKRLSLILAAQPMACMMNVRSRAIAMICWLVMDLLCGKRVG